MRKKRKGSSSGNGSLAVTGRWSYRWVVCKRQWSQGRRFHFRAWSWRWNNYWWRGERSRWRSCWWRRAARRRKKNAKENGGRPCVGVRSGVCAVGEEKYGEKKNISRRRVWEAEKKQKQKIQKKWGQPPLPVGGSQKIWKKKKWGRSQ